MVESSALLKRRTPKGYRGFESLPHRALDFEGLTLATLQSIKNLHKWICGLTAALERAGRRWQGHRLAGVRFIVWLRPCCVRFLQPTNVRQLPS